MLKICWADKIGLALLGVLTFALFFLGNLNNPERGSWAWIEAGLSILWIVGSKTVLPVWLFLRLIDFLAGGPHKRAGWLTVKPIEEHWRQAD